MLHFLKNKRSGHSSIFLCVSVFAISIRFALQNVKCILRNAIKHKLRLMTHTQSFHFQFTTPTSFCGFRLILPLSNEWRTTRERSKQLACVKNKLTLKHTHTHCTKHDPRGECDVVKNIIHSVTFINICAVHTGIQKFETPLKSGIFQILHF